MRETLALAPLCTELYIDTARTLASPHFLSRRSMSLTNGQTTLSDKPHIAVVSDEEISLIEILNAFLRERWFIVGIALAMAGFVGVTGLLTPRSYTVTASFLVQRPEQNSAANGLAAQLGMDLGATDPSQSPAFYVALIKTPDVLGRIIDSTFRTSTDPRPRPLAQILKITAKTPALRRDAVIKAVQGMITASPSPKLDLVSLEVVSGDPLLSTELAKSILSEVNRFNLETRQTRAAAERQFDERLVAEVGAQLRQAEDETQRFLQTNQQPHMSAALEMEKQRLNRQLEILNARYLGLVTAFDRARIDEVRDTPVITVIERPEVPVRPDGRGITKRTIFAFLIGLFIGAALALVRQLFRAMRNSPQRDAREFHRLLFDTSHDVRRMWSGVRTLPDGIKRLRSKRA